MYIGIEGGLPCMHYAGGNSILTAPEYVPHTCCRSASLIAVVSANSAQRVNERNALKFLLLGAFV
jgi:hypothetical protein